MEGSSPDFRPFGRTAHHRESRRFDEEAQSDKLPWYCCGLSIHGSSRRSRGRLALYPLRDFTAPVNEEPRSSLFDADVVLCGEASVTQEPLFTTFSDLFMNGLC